MTPLRMAAYLRIAHHIPGRIRLGLAAGAEQGDWGSNPLGQINRFCHALAGVSGIRSVRVNPLARSCTVDYDPAAIPPVAWRDLLTGIGSDAANELRSTLQAIEAAVAKG